MEQHMGLDMFAFTTDTEPPAVDFDNPEDSAELSYWRKHPDLHGWMEALYRSKGGTDEVFNLSTVRLDGADLDALEAAVKGKQLPLTMGFFFGKSQPQYKRDDLDFIQKARAALANGKKVFYTSWW
jgi:hypothetical protein